MRHMPQIRPLTPAELEASIPLFANAYPGLDLFNYVNRTRYRERLATLQRDPTTSFHGFFEAGQLRGVMRWHDFTMNFFGVPALVGGLGGVAVDLLHKKEKIAARMVRAFLDHYRQAGACLTALYPFRPDFYRRMGFGFGTPMNNYQFLPANLPAKSDKTGLAFLDSADRRALHACYERYFERKHGLMARRVDYWDAILEEPSLQTVGVIHEGQLTGYAVYSFEKGARASFLSNALHLRELVYDRTADLHRLLHFLHSQADQVELISYTTQDEGFYYLLSDARRAGGDILPDTIAHESSTQGLGIMYRVIDVPRLFEVLATRNFGDVSCRLEIVLADSFLPANSASYLIEAQSGQVRLASGIQPEVRISLDVAEFSSLVTGAVGFDRLVEYGLVTLSDSNFRDHLQRLFAGPKPICLTAF